MSREKRRWVNTRVCFSRPESHCPNKNGYFHPSDRSANIAINSICKNATAMFHENFRVVIKTGLDPLIVLSILIEEMIEYVGVHEILHAAFFADNPMLRLDLLNGVILEAHERLVRRLALFLIFPMVLTREEIDALDILEIYENEN